MNLSKIITPIAYGLVFLLTGIYIVWLFNEDPDQIQATKESAAVSMGFAITYTLFAIAILAIIGMTVTALVNKPKSSITILIGLGVIVLLYFFGYVMDQGEVTEVYSKGGIITTEGDSKMVGGVLTATIYMLLFAVGFSIFSSLKSLINKING